MFRPDANLGLRIVRTILVPSGPLIAAVVLASSGLVSERAAKFLVMVGFAWFFSFLIIVPALLFRDDSSPGSSSDEGGGGGGGSQPPPPRDPRPGGGIPLPDAEPSRERVRDHVRAKRPWPRRRTAQPPCVPGRTPSRVSRRRR